MSDNFDNFDDLTPREIADLQLQAKERRNQAIRETLQDRFTQDPDFLNSFDLLLEDPTKPNTRKRLIIQLGLRFLEVSDEIVRNTRASLDIMPEQHINQLLSHGIHALFPAYAFGAQHQTLLENDEARRRYGRVIADSTLFYHYAQTGFEEMLKDVEDDLRGLIQYEFGETGTSAIEPNFRTILAESFRTVGQVKDPQELVSTVVRSIRQTAVNGPSKESIYTITVLACAAGAASIRKLNESAGDAAESTGNLLPVITERVARAMLAIQEQITRDHEDSD